MDVQLTHLRTLAAVARHGGFSRAAATLGLTQPAVSMQVRQLERTVGAALLERVGKRAFPTPAGELILAAAGRAVRELEEGLERIQQLRGVVAGRVRLGTSASISIYLLPPIFRRVRSGHPRVELTVVTGNAPEIAAAVRAGDLDIGVVSLPVRDRELTVEPFHDDELVAIARPEPPWRRLASAGAGRLAREPLILYEHGGTVRRVIDGWFRRGGAMPAQPMELGNTEAIKKLVEAGLGLSIASWFSVRDDVRAGRLVAVPLDPPLIRRIGVIRRRDRATPPAVEAFLAVLEAARPRLPRRHRRRPRPG